MKKVINIDDYLETDRIIKRDLNIERFVLIGKLKESGDILSYIDSNITLEEILLLIDTLIERKKQLFDH